MKTYEELYTALVNLCKKENLKLIEEELEDVEIVYLRFEDKIVLNTNCSKYPASSQNKELRK